MDNGGALFALIHEIFMATKVKQQVELLQTRLALRAPDPKMKSPL